MFWRLLKWSWGNNRRLFAWLKRRPNFFVKLLVLPFWLYALIGNGFITMVAAALVGPVGFFFLILNRVLVMVRDGAQRRIRGAGLIGKCLYGSIWMVSSVMYGISHVVEVLLTIGEAADAMGVIER